MPTFGPEELRAAVMRKLSEEPVAETAAAPEKPTGIGVAPYAALVGGSAADLGSTLSALGRGAHEANPLLSHGGTPGLIAGKAVGTLALAWAMRALANHGHPTAAKAIGYGGGAAFGAAAAHNMTQGR